MSVFSWLRKSPVPKKCHLFFDFDGTITAKHLFFLVNGSNDPADITQNVLDEIFPSHQVANWKYFLDQIEAINNDKSKNVTITFDIVSKNFAKMIHRVFDMLHILLPLKTQVIGREMLIAGYDGEKGHFVRQKISCSQLESSQCLFIDDDVLNERAKVTVMCPTVKIFMPVFAQGLQREHYEAIVDFCTL